MKESRLRSFYCIYVLSVSYDRDASKRFAAVAQAAWAAAVGVLGPDPAPTEMGTVATFSNGRTDRRSGSPSQSPI